MPLIYIQSVAIVSSVFAMTKLQSARGESYHKVRWTAVMLLKQLCLVWVWVLAVTDSKAVYVGRLFSVLERKS